MHYLTTQDVEANRDGRPELMSPFMKKLYVHGDNNKKSTFPLQPSITGNLVTSDLSASLTLEAGGLYLVTVTDMVRGRISPPTAVNTNNNRPTTTEEQQPQDGLILAILSLITLIFVVAISVGIWIRRKFLSEKLDKTCLKNEQIVARNNIFNKAVTKASNRFTQNSLLPISQNLEDLKCFVPFIKSQNSRDSHKP